jgi:N6-L-threonylcarbamoyladenine synthase
MPVIQEAIHSASVTLDDISGIAVTKGPGLVGGLLVGISAAKSIAYAKGIPLVGVNHVEGHIYANFLDHQELVPPALCLTVSGGHTVLLFIKEYGHYELLGRTKDDAAGEAFDKVARVMGLGYPGGPAIDDLSKNGNPDAYQFPRVMPGSLDFSFSGLKTAALNIINNKRQKSEDIAVADLAASFQKTVVDMLIDRVLMAVRQTGITSVMLSGGVAANSELRRRLTEAVETQGGKVYFPSIKLCTDNGAMIACSGHYRLEAGERAKMDLNAEPGLKLV